MKKVILKERPEELNISDLSVSDHIGFIDTNGYKGHFVHIGLKDDFGNNTIHAIRPCDGDLGPTITYGRFEENQYYDIPEKLSTQSINIQEMYYFNSYKELYKWLSED